MPYTLLVGGARSGKSDLAGRMASTAGAPVVVLATAEARDAEMARRIAAHRADRPDAWETIEEPVELVEAAAAVPPEVFVVVDCVTLWVANLLACDDDEIVARAARLGDVLAGRPGGGVVVTNEVGGGIVPANAEARRFRDLLGRVIVALADRADRACLVVAGRILDLERWNRP